MTEPVYLIVLDRADADELNNVQEIVKQNARGWWHRYTNVWFAGGGESASYWRDLIKPAIKPDRPSSVLVLRLPQPGGRGWAAFGPNVKESMEWIHKNYS